MTTYDSLAVVLSGGNALGSYQAGALEALQSHAMEPHWMVGASTGAINAAIFCGNDPAARIGKLRQFWQAGEDLAAGSAPAGGVADASRRTASVNTTLAWGRPGMFAPRYIYGPWWNPFGNPEPSSLFDTTPLADTLARHVDFERLNTGAIRLSVAAVDIQAADDVVFDTRTQALSPDHIRASGAMMPLFPPVEIEGRLLADAGASANLPIDPVLADPPAGRTVCLAIDLVPLRMHRPERLGDAIQVMQDLVFARQGQRAIAAWERIYAGRMKDAADANAAAPAVTLIHLGYDGERREVCGKALDFSPESAADRWHQGRSDMAHIIRQLDAGAIQPGDEGLTIYRYQGDQRI